MQLCLCVSLHLRGLRTRVVRQYSCGRGWPWVLSELLTTYRQGNSQ